MNGRPTKKPSADDYPATTGRTTAAELLPGRTGRTESALAAGPGSPPAAGTEPATDAATVNAEDPSRERAEWAEAQLRVAAHRICPGCGTAMVDRSCKLRCLCCGFFLDCSDG